METFVHNIGEVLGITLLHSLWQGLLIYVVIRLAFIAFPAASSAKKYNALYAALTSIAIWFAYTFFMEAKVYNWTTLVEQNFTLVKDVPLSNTTVKQSTPIDQPFYYSYKAVVKAYLPYISALYLISVLINLVRLAMGWQSIRRIKKLAKAATEWQPLTNRLANHAGIIKRVQISLSNLVDVPCVFGYLKPVILLPVSISTQLSAEEIEVIILHELAHLKNNDYILNLIQQLIALLLFLNPFAQLISRMINVERENRCDDTVVQIGDPLTYAGALVKLEKTRQGNLQLALAVTGKKYHLFDRVKRIMNHDKPAVNIKHLVFGLLIFIGSLGSIAWLNPEIKDGKLVSKNGAAAVQQLAKIVKEAIKPDVAESIKPDDNYSEVTVKSLADNSIKISADSTAVKKTEREALVAEYLALQRVIDKDRNELNEIPEMKELTRLRKELDSLRKIKWQSIVLPPDLEQEKKDRTLASNAYFHSDLYQQKNNTYKRLISKYFDALNRQPEMIQYESVHKRVWDSLSTKIMQANGITKYQLDKIPEWREWSNNDMHIRDALILKLNSVPEVKILNDSVEYARHYLYSGPEFEEYQKKTRASDAFMKATEDPPNLDKYKAAIKAASIPIQNTEVWKRLDKNGKRHDEIVDKLYNRH